MKILDVLLTILLLVLSLNAVASESCTQEYRFEALNQVIQEVFPRVEEKLSFRDDITASSINSLLRRIDKMIAKNKDRELLITLSLDSGGGNINETIRAVNRIRELNNDPLIQIDTKVASGSCESACTILFTAGEKRLATKHAQFGFHSPKFQSGNKGTLTKREIEDRYRKIWLGYVSAIDENTAAIIKDRRYLMDEEMSYMSAKELKNGYVTDII